ncbi:MAG: NAD(+) diphosphatase [Polyangiaceae bacterium]|jgi:NAD+ diphosphatase
MTRRPHLFIPGVEPPATTAPPLWIAFRDEEIFVDGETMLLESLEPLGLSAPSAGAAGAFYLGTLDERPIFVVAQADAPANARFVSLRAALMTVGREGIHLLALAAERVRFERTHVFCGRCGARTVDKAGERAKSCPACGLHVYPPVSPAIIVLIHDGRRMLLARRKKMQFFALVAGFVESGESLEHCLAREVREEVGVEVTDLRYFGSQPWPFPHQIMIGFYARWAGGEVRADGVEIDEARWYDPEALPHLPPTVSIARAMIDAFVAQEKS